MPPLSGYCPPEMFSSGCQGLYLTIYLTGNVAFERYAM